MDNFFELLNKVVKLSSGKIDGSVWTEEYQDAVDKLHNECYAYAQRRFDSGYDMGYRHCRDKHQKAVMENKRNESEYPGTQVILTCRDLY